MFNYGNGVGLSNLATVVDAETRSISPENFDGAKGGGGRATEGTGKDKARDLGHGWKISPSIEIAAGEEREIALIDGPGVIEQIWMTPTGKWRYSILRVYYDDSDTPAIECPVGDFFANGWGCYAAVNSLAVCVNPGSSFNCYWPMPFRKRLRMTLTNIDEDPMILYYQINYSLQAVPDDAAYFHAQFRRVNPLPYKDVYTIVDGIEGRGHYVGTYMAWGVNDGGWWGEGEIKFYLDGDEEYPTVCGTGTEDYFCGSYNFENQVTHQYEEYTTAYAGLPQVIRPDGLYNSQTRFGMYRWHLTDPVRFKENLRITIQALGWTQDRRMKYRPLKDDIASVAYWYQQGQAKPFPPLPSRDELEVTVGGGPHGGAPVPW